MVLPSENVRSVFVDVSNNACITKTFIYYSSRPYSGMFVRHYPKSKHQNWWNAQQVCVECQNAGFSHEYRSRLGNRGAQIQTWALPLVSSWTWARLQMSPHLYRMGVGRITRANQSYGVPNTTLSAVYPSHHLALTASPCTRQSNYPFDKEGGEAQGG